MRNILYISTAVSPKDKLLIEKIIKRQENPSLIPIYKYHSAMMLGLAKNNSYVTSLYCAPISSKNVSTYFKPKQIYSEKNISYIGIGFPTWWAIKNLFGVLQMTALICRWVKKNNENYTKNTIIVDGSFVTGLLSLRLATLIIGTCRLNVIATILDVYDYMHPKVKPNFSLKYLKWWLYNNVLKRTISAYIVITEPTNQLVNISKKPYLVVEGVIDPSFVLKEYKGAKRKVVMYAGGLHERYGIRLLIDAYCKINTEYVLELYGEGDQITYISEKALSNKNIRYCGSNSLSKILRAEQSAMYLINPRPTHSNFVKYSFPSKLIEYLSSGTPTITSHLPCIPQEYDQYLNYIDVSSPSKLKDQLQELLSDDYSLYKKRAMHGRTWVLHNKGSVSTGKKIVKLIERME